MTPNRFKRRLAQLEAALNFVHEGISYGVDTVQDIHRGIVELPLEQLHISGVVDLDQQKREQLWQSSFGMVYRMIHSTNQAIQQTEEKLFSAIDEQIDAQQNIQRISYKPDSEQP
ncbi:MAG: hypothetical protein WA154_04340 [Moraxellaceae bacterium]